MNIKPASVKELRERTGAGMMDCKRALVEAEGDLDKALEELRKSGQAKADKKSARVAAEGGVFTASVDGKNVIVEINCETDFVGKDENFLQFAKLVTDTILAQRPADVAALGALAVEGGTLEEVRKALVAKIGENVAIRRFELLESANSVASYVHGGRIGVLVEIEGGDDQLARDLALQVAASAPQYVTPEQVPSDALDKERVIFSAQAEQEGKPAHIVEKMVEGRLRKFVDEITLLGQPFVKDPNQRVRDLLKQNKAQVVRFLRFEVGEGIEKEEVDFATEVMAQASQSR